MVSFVIFTDFKFSTQDKPQQNESSNSSTFIANSHSIFAVSEPSKKPQLTGRQIAETILVPMIERQIQLPPSERDLFVSLNDILSSLIKL